jgi:hypothetical protein
MEKGTTVHRVTTNTRMDSGAETARVMSGDRCTHGTRQPYIVDKLEYLLGEMKGIGKIFNSLLSSIGERVGFLRFLVDPALALGLLRLPAQLGSTTGFLDAPELIQ